jgi:hypothetical protein
MDEKAIREKKGHKIKIRKVTKEKKIFSLSSLMYHATVVL